jgi:hypothetical protein
MTQATKLSRREPSQSPDILRIEPDAYCYRAWQNLSIGVWVGQATLPAVKGLLDVGRQMVTRYPEGHSSIVFILDKIPAPTPEGRELLTRIFAGGSALTCTAVILEGSGFWASGLRSMIGNTHRSASGPVRLRVNTSIDEALEWLPAEHTRFTGVTLNVEELRKTLIAVRERDVITARGVEP